MTANVTAIIVAAGKGQRFGALKPKQFVEIKGKPVLWHTLLRFQASPIVNEIFLILPEEDFSALKSAVEKNYHFPKISKILPGGSNRYNSVWQGLINLDADSRFVVIHDGVRPLVSVQMIQDVVLKANETGASVLGVAPKDTLKSVRDGIILNTLDREQIVQIQTPQCFKKEIILKAYQKAFEQNLYGTDDASLVENIGIHVHLVQGDYRNIKITSPEDLIFAEALLDWEEKNENRARI